MIRTITGTVQDIKSDHIILNVFGFGLGVYMPKHNIATLRLEAEVCLYTHLALREHAVDLYGFSDEATLQFFELLLGVSGVGPRSALGITNLAPVETLVDAIRARDISYLTRVAGVGKKMAEKIILELKEKVGGEGEAMIRTDDIEILDTLIALGFKEKEAKNILHAIPNTITEKDARLKAALKQS